MHKFRKLCAIFMFASTCLSATAFANELICSGCRTLEDAARVGTGYLWDRGNGFAGILPAVGGLNEVRLVNPQLGISFEVELSVGWFGVSLGPLGSLTFLSTLSRNFIVVDNLGAKLRDAYTVSELDLNASVWRLASHLGFSTAMAVYSELGGWELSNAPFTDLSVVDGAFGLNLSFQRHYNYQPNAIAAITECSTPSCGLSTQGSAQAPGGSLSVPVPSEEPKNRER